MSPQRYLADTSAAAAAVNEFSEVLTGVGPEARPAPLRRVAVRLVEPLARTAAIAARLDAARLEDRRLEAQRARAAAALSEVADAMSDLLAAARAGDSEAAESASNRFSTAVGELRRLPTG